jgi:hypothetical protein
MIINITATGEINESSDDTVFILNMHESNPNFQWQINNRGSQELHLFLVHIGIFSDSLNSAFTLHSYYVKAHWQILIE